ncbi:MAG TPA: hypothetical protein VIF82_11760 [Burkholderiaceae bacterium]|jgi:hypothetical protein
MWPKESLAKESSSGMPDNTSFVRTRYRTKPGVIGLAIPMLKRWLLIAVFLMPLIIWAYLKPTQAISSMPGISCVSAFVCTNDPSTNSEAIQLYDEGFKFVSSKVGTLYQKPIVVFCKSEICFQAFGPSRATAKSLGTFCIVIGPKGWKPYYVRHEMIHFLQEERLGFIGTMLSPTWFREGMAYKLSEDPRPVLAEPWQQHRLKFESWYQKIDKAHLWEEARKL